MYEIFCKIFTFLQSYLNTSVVQNDKRNRSVILTLHIGAVNLQNLMEFSLKFPYSFFTTVAILSVILYAYIHILLSY